MIGRISLFSCERDKLSEGKNVSRFPTEIQGIIEIYGSINLSKRKQLKLKRELFRVLQPLLNVFKNLQQAFRTHLSRKYYCKTILEQTEKTDK